MPETPQNLLARNQPLLDAIDLDTIDANARGCIQAGELSGTAICDDSGKEVKKGSSQLNHLAILRTSHVESDSYIS